MQTIYYKTSNFIQHTGNLVDLNEYRRKQALAQQDSLARQPEELDWYEEKEADVRLVVLPAPKERRRTQREQRAWTLDACASLAVVFMTVLFALRVML